MIYLVVAATVLVASVILALIASALSGRRLDQAINAVETELDEASSAIAELADRMAESSERLTGAALTLQAALDSDLSPGPIALPDKQLELLKLQGLGAPGIQWQDVQNLVALTDWTFDLEAQRNLLFRILNRGQTEPSSYQVLDAYVSLDTISSTIDSTGKGAERKYPLSRWSSSGKGMKKWRLIPAVTPVHHAAGR